VENIIVNEERGAEEEHPDESVVGFLRLREIPSAYRTVDGTVKPSVFYEAFDIGVVGDASGTARMHDLGEWEQPYGSIARVRFLRKIVRAITHAVRGVVRVVRRTAAAVQPK